MTSCQACYCTNEKGKCEIFFCNYRSDRTTLQLTHRRLCRVKNMLAMYLKYSIASISLTLHMGLWETHRPVTTKKHEKVRQHWRQKRKKAYVHIKRVKSDSYLSYGQSCKTNHVKHGIIRKYPPPPSPPPIQINSFVL